MLEATNCLFWRSWIVNWNYLKHDFLVRTSIFMEPGYKITFCLPYRKGENAFFIVSQKIIVTADSKLRTNPQWNISRTTITRPLVATVYVWRTFNCVYSCPEWIFYSCAYLKKVTETNTFLWESNTWYF